MKRPLLARLAVLGAAGLLGLGLVSPAHAAPTPDEELSAGWLADQVPASGIVDNRYGAGEDDVYDDHGLSADILVALSTLDAEPQARTALADGLTASVEAYTTGAAFGDRPDSRYAGSVGKLAVALQLAGRDVRDVQGQDLIAILEDVIPTEGANAGRAIDRSDFGDYANAIKQSWVVRALAVAGADLVDETTDYLTRQQCADGSVIEQITDAGCTAGSGQVDATAFALQAFAVARDHGVGGLQDEIDAATRYLLASQAADGSFLGEGTANTNTTGLAAHALQASGGDRALAGAARAAGWVYDKQVTPRQAGGTPLADEVGAIAYDQAALDTGRSQGIAPVLRDQWRRATAQAVLALPAADVQVDAPRFGATGSTVAVDIARLDAGESFTVEAGDVDRVGTADAAGTATIDVTLPDEEGTITLRVQGTDSGRTGTTVLDVLGPAEFDVVVDPEVVEPGERFTVGFGDSAPADGEPLELFVVPADVLEEVLDEQADDASARAMSAPQTRALSAAAVDRAAAGAVRSEPLLAPEQEGEYAVVVLSEVDDRGGIAGLTVAVDDAPAAGAEGPSGSGSGTVGASSALPAAGADLPSWWLWAGVALLLAGLATVVRRWGSPAALSPAARGGRHL